MDWVHPVRRLSTKYVYRDKTEGSGQEDDEDIFIHSGYFYSASLGPPLFRGAPNTARILSRHFKPKRHRQLRVKNLPKVCIRGG